MACSLRFITIVVGTLLCGVQICVGDEHSDSFKEYCPVSNNEAIFENLKRIMDNCGKKLAESEQRYQSHGSNRVEESAAFKICRSQEILKGCMEEVSNTLDPCFHGDMKLTKTMTFESIEALLEYVCKDNGEAFSAFIDNGIPCMSKKIEEVKECAKTTIGKLKTEACSGTKCINSEDEETVCRGVHDLKTCLANTLRKCEDKTTSDFVEGLIHTSMKSMQCHKYAGLSGSESIVHPLAQAVISTIVAFISTALL